jgi:hypothetical protein
VVTTEVLAAEARSSLHDESQPASMSINSLIEYGCTTNVGNHLAAEVNAL